jgi:nitrate reductase gamma subunit
MYELARGPMLWVAAIVFLGGTGYRIRQLFRLTERKQRARCPARGTRASSPEERKLKLILALRNSLLGQHPVMAIVSFLFHLCLFAVPLLTLAHNLLLRDSWGISFFSLPDEWIDLLTIVVLAGAVFFLARRVVIPRVRAISTPSDYLVLLITAAPFLTGLAAYRQWGDYRTILTLHVLSGELMLVAIPFTKLGHMVFFFFARIFLASEFNVWRGNRTWST